MTPPTYVAGGQPTASQNATRPTRHPADCATRPTRITAVKLQRKRHVPVVELSTGLRGTPDIRDGFFRRVDRAGHLLDDPVAGLLNDLSQALAILGKEVRRVTFLA